MKKIRSVEKMSATYLIIHGFDGAIDLSLFFQDFHKP